MKILHLNIYEGAQETERFHAIINFINEHQPDIVGLSELNNWQKNNFKKISKFKEQTHLQHHAFVEASSGYNLGLFSKYPLTNTITISKGFKTGLIITEINNIQYVLTHLDSRNEDFRLAELRIIFKKLSNKPIILMGDLNSLSPKDNYPHLLKLLQSQNIHKFGKDSLRTEVIQELEKQGFTDAIHQLHPFPVFSVPTSFNKDKFHADNLRLDYIFTKNVHLTKAKILHDRKTNQLSDHFPLMAEF